MTERRPMLANIHALRAIAAMLVVLLHASEQLEPGSLPFHAEFGNAGVDIFFVISGFVMVYTSTVRAKSPGAFMLDRILRIVPMYWTFTLLTVLLILVVPTAFRGSSFDPIHTLFSFIFVAYPHPVNADSFSPVLRVGWTLNYEMVFYLIFATAIWIRNSSRVFISISVLLALVLARPLLGLSGVFQFYGQAIILEFGLGMLAAGVFLRGGLKQLPAVVGWLLIAVGAGILLNYGHSVDMASNSRILWFGVPATLIVSGALILERFREKASGRIVNILGAASYVIYLSHPYVLTASRLFLEALDVQSVTPLGAISVILVMLLVSALVGILVHLYFEKPVTRFLRLRLEARGVAHG